MTRARIQVLGLVHDLAQSHRIARRLQCAQTSVQSALLWLKSQGFVTYEGSRWNMTEAGRAALRASTEEGKTATPSVKDEEAGRG